MSRKLVLLLLFVFTINSCKNQKASDENTTQQQEEKIKALEERLNKVESEKGNNYTQPPLDTSRPVIEPITVSKPEKKKKYFSIGSTESEVLEVMGDPTSIHDFSLTKIYTYGLSDVTFRNGKVIEYSNMGGNLKIKISSDDD